MSPVPTPGGALQVYQQQPQQTSGMPPVAKRPRNLEDVAMNSGQPGKIMSNEMLTAGFLNIVELEERDRKAISDIGQCVALNSELLNAVIT